MNVLNIDSISSVTFKECSTYLTSRYLYSLADLPVDSIHPDGETDPFITRMALKLFPSARHLTTEYNRAKEKKGQTSWFHELLGHQFKTATLSVFCYNMVLSVDDLTLCNSRELALFGFMIDAEHLNLFLKKWIKGSNPSLTSLEMKFARKKRNAEDFDDILEGIDYKKSGFTFENEVDGIKIEGQNGIVATLFMIQDTYLSVCHLIMLINDTCPVSSDLNGPNLIVRSLLKRENEIVENLLELPSDEHLVIEEGSKYQICVKYHVQHETIYGLEYQQTICRQNTVIEHGEFLMNGYVSKDLYKVRTPTMTWSFGEDTFFFEDFALNPQ
ncbi:hypothetical protein CAEBREN_21091 [Caenorhabditis brenneri]|uniref:Sdz-33 F-box domain-containing protein n=1 Tax=Caenorhabditis brenneri TaxID=135651 RepID=G0M7W9_CAEBE|nr:hypothetical protein CAEBREN_21091 [Caenorhabditis brenneri]